MTEYEIFLKCEYCGNKDGFYQEVELESDLHKVGTLLDPHFHRCDKCYNAYRIEKVKEVKK